MEYKSAAELKKDLSALKLQIAFQEMEEQALDSDAGDNPELDKAVKRSESGMLRLLNRTLRRREVRRTLKSTLPKLAKCAAALLLVFFLGLSTAVATVRSVRLALLDFIINIESEYTELSLENSSNAYMEIPAEWRGSYYPAYIPKGFHFVEMNGLFDEVLYADEANRHLTFSEYDAGDYTNIDTENAQISTILLHGTSALVSEKKGHTFVVWSLDNRYFIINIEASREEAIKIAESVRMIK